MSNKISVTNILKTFFGAFFGGLNFGKRIVFLILLAGLIFLASPIAFSEVEETSPEPSCIEETCGATPTPTPTPTADETVISTGDAQSEVTVENSANTSEVTSSPPEPTPTPASEEVPTTEESPAPDTNIAIDNGSAADVATTATSTAETGENAANENPGSATIDTGGANASADIINVVNSTFTDSNGLVLLLNIFSSFFGDLDFSDSNTFTSDCSDNCSIFSGDLSVNNQNTATVSNDVVVRAETGGNSASGNAGDGTVLTGDANAAANVLNIVNTNVVGSNYLLLILNNFGSWSGDLVLPSKYLFQNCCSGGGNVNASNDNSASIENNISGDAETGANDASGGNAGLIVTGTANAVNNAVTKANTNIFGSDSVLIAFRFFGDWTGNVFSAPDGFTWTESNGGLVLIGGGDGSLGGGANTTNIENTNQAAIRNNIRALALTGANKAAGNGGTSTIATGNANSVTNVVNIVNTNVFGRNWILALVNVFGNWNGNIAFGRPDLWVGESVSAIPREAVPGDRFTYTLTVVNNGDTDATNVLLHDDFDERYLNPTSLNGGNRTDRGAEWTLGLLKPGEARVISYEVEIRDNLPAGGTIISNTASVSSFEEDGKNDDNIEQTSLIIDRKRELNITSSALPDFKMKKTHTASTTALRAGDKVEYKIVLNNAGGGKGYQSKITDKLYYATATEPVSVREWPLDTVLDGEEIAITYTLEFSQSAAPGVYKNTAKFSAKDESGVDRYFVTAEDLIEILPPEPPPPPVPEELALAEELPLIAPEPASIEREITEVAALITDYVANPNEEEVEEQLASGEEVAAPPPPAPPRTPMFRNLMALAFLNFKWIWQWFATTAVGILAAIYLRLYG